MPRRSCCPTYGAPTYGESGLALVFRENVVRFFDPFDHMGPIYTYLIYLPAYTLPWVPCWLLGLWLAVRHWRQTPPNVRWLVWGLGLLFVFFTASGSRRSYYVLPLVPFAQLLGAWWLSERLANKTASGRAGRRFAFTAALLLLILGVAYPWSNGNGGVTRFAQDVQAQAGQNRALEPMADGAGGSRQQTAHVPAEWRPPFYYVAQTQDFPRQGDSAAFMAWLDTTSGQHFDPQRTIIVAPFSKDDPTPLAYLGRIIG
jgi:hypothetical protein